MTKATIALTILNSLKNGMSVIEAENVFKNLTGDIIPAHVFYRTADLHSWLERYILSH